MKRLTIVLCCLSFPFITQAQTWLGAISTDWNTPGNWSGGTVPINSTTPIFDGTSTNNCTISGNVTVAGFDMFTGYTGTISLAANANLIIGNGDYLQQDGTFNCGTAHFLCTNNANFYCSGGIFIASSDTTTLGDNLIFQRSFQHNNGVLVLNSISGTTLIEVNNSVTDTVTLNNVIVDCGNATSTYRISATNTVIIKNDLQIVQGCLDGSVNGSDTSKVILWGNLSTNQTGVTNNRTSTIDIDFAGNNNTSIAMAAGGETLLNCRLTLNKTSAEKTVTLNTPLILNSSNDEVNFKKGKLVTSSTNLLTIAIDGINMPGASDSSFIDGPLAKTGNNNTDAFIFPVGDNGVYAPITASGSTNALTPYITNGIHTLTAEYFRANPNVSYDTMSKDGSLHNVGTCEYWHLNADANGVISPYVWLSYDSTRSCGIADVSSLRVSKWDTTATPSARWIDLGQASQITVNGLNFISTSIPLSSFSPFNLASANAANPLPLSLIEFGAVYTNNLVRLDWKMSASSAGENFTVERSQDGLSFVPIGQVSGFRTAGTTNEYTYYDASALSARNYYRLLIKNNDGSSTYSKVVVVNVSSSITDLIVYPNPAAAGASLTIQIPALKTGKGYVQIFAVDGKKLFSAPVSADGSGFASIYIPKGFPAGLYLLMVTADGSRYCSRLSVENRQ